jgi:hypothetical protein
MDGATTYTVAARPEGGGCVVVFDTRISDEADRKAIEHLVDSFEVDCGRVSSGPLPASSASASPSASLESIDDRAVLTGILFVLKSGIP